MSLVDCHILFILGAGKVMANKLGFTSALISIVDDDPFVRDATDALVRSLGYGAATFASAEDFIRSDYIHKTACVITDVQMPGLSGVELQRVMIAQGNLVPVIFITAYANEIVRRSVMEAGAIAYLSKPFDEESLIQHLRTALATYYAAESRRRAVR